MKQKNILNLFLIIIVTFIFPINCRYYALISIPKCGTHLLLRTMSLISRINNHIGPKGWCIFDDATLNIFLRKPVLLKTHALYIEQNIIKFRHPSIKTFFIYRDPRDQIISAAFWVKKTVKEWPLQSTWSLEAIITELITGGGPIWGAIFSAQEIWQNLCGITSFYDLYLPWLNEQHIYSTTFEKLIGNLGGGNKDVQLQEIIAIAHHMGKKISLRDADTISKKLFGNSMTFREGKIGSWKKHFTEEHTKAFKHIAGNLLIKLGYEQDLNW